jgi:hypothetical protein
MANLPTVSYELIRLSGGLDQVTPTLSLAPGVARRAANFECAVNGGYTRITGYERFDGRPAPSAALYNVLSCTFLSAVAVGDTILGSSSAASGKVIAVTDDSVVITREVGIFLTGEQFSVSGTPAAEITAVLGVASDGQTDATYRSLAADDYRADIGAVPGSGPVRGVAYFNGNLYAWRDNAGGTQLDLYKSSSSGWTQIEYFGEFDFDVGVREIFPGDTIVGHLSGATALVKAVIVQTGSWSTGDAAGYIVFTDMTGTPVANEHVYVDGSKHAESVGTYAMIEPLPGGRVQAVVANYGGGAQNKKIFFVDGLNRCHSFDGETVVPIRTGMAADAPSHIAFHKQHLFLAFGASLQFSAIANPYSWDPVLGAGEIVMNENITNLLTLPGDQTSGALGVYTRNDTSVLYGTSAESFQLSTFNSGTGAIPYTAQNMDQAYVLDDRGVVSLGTSLNFGNFLPASLTMNLRPFLSVRKNLASASTVNRDKGQYRVFFSDGYSLYLTIMNSKYLGAMPVQYAHPVLCCFESEDSDGNATAYFGSSNGFVYQMDRGTSFDGLEIQAGINLIYNSIKSPRVLKRYRKASVELTGDAWAEFAFGCDLGYRTQQLDQPVDAVYENDLRSAFWDSFTWDQFVWDGQELSPNEVDVAGTAENIAIRISSVSAILKPFTVNSIIVHYSTRRGIR